VPVKIISAWKRYTLWANCVHIFEACSKHITVTHKPVVLFSTIFQSSC
jgi:hypothetical protein